MKEITLRVKFNYGDEVYFIFPGEYNRGVVTALEVRGKHVMYQVTWADRGVSYHIGEELTDIANNIF